MAAAEVERQLRSGRVTLHAAAAAADVRPGGFGHSKAHGAAAPSARADAAAARVVAVAFAPSSDSYVRSKLGHEALSCAVRCELCDLAAADEAEEHAQKRMASSHDAAAASNGELSETGGGDRMPAPPQLFPMLTLDYNCASEAACAKQLDENLRAAYPGRRFLTLCAYGSDFACKYGKLSNMMCVQRHDSERSGDKVQEMIAKHGAGDNFIFVPTVESDVPTASSTAIRAALLSPGLPESQGSARVHDASARRATHALLHGAHGGRSQTVRRDTKESGGTLQRSSRMLRCKTLLQPTLARASGGMLQRRRYFVENQSQHNVEKRNCVRSLP